ncbi:MAG: hypothetical protein HZA50_12870 [Planctomycetes bacterium]|nr:hypothetical protein [Planctomycetota bacterium]
MPKELSSEISIQRINLTCKTSDLNAVASAMRHAGAEIVGNFRSKFDRKADQTTVEADVFLEASAGEDFQMWVSARISAIYRGDQVRCGPPVREKISARLVEIFRKHCEQMAIEAAIKNTRRKGSEG